MLAASELKVSQLVIDLELLSTNLSLDDVLVTETGYDDLTGTPKSVEEMESF
jgi:hypothetical protein